MKKITIEIPEDEKELKNYPIRELEKGCKKEMEKRWRGWVKKMGFLGIRKTGEKTPTGKEKWKQHHLQVPFCCETCKYVGTEFWHCHNPKSFKQHINVDRDDLCNEYFPNDGLILYLWYSEWRKYCEESRKESFKFLKNIRNSEKGRSGGQNES